MVAILHWPLFVAPIEQSDSVDRTLFILEKLGNPQNNLKNIFHITGTNGKGSTSVYIENILRSCGISVNLYTSPHIYYYNERIKLNGIDISDANLYCHVEAVREICEKYNIYPTMFEVTTIAAFLAFSENPAQATVVEVGMGGRMDATNVFHNNPPIAAIFTPIHIDHIEFLGATVEMNAIEKSFIIKQGTKIISAPQQKTTIDILQAQSRDMQSSVYLYGEDFCIDFIEERPLNMVFSSANEQLMLEKPSLAGSHQIINAAVAIMSVCVNRNCFSAKINENHISNGIKTAYWPVRMEPVLNRKIVSILPEGSEVFIDGAHNISGAQAIANFLAEKTDALQNYIIVGRTKNTDSFNFLLRFKDIVKKIFAVRVQLEAMPQAPELIVSSGLKAGIEIEKANNILDAIEKISIICGTNPVRIIICGSLYLARDLKAI
jgi:dihydrofolate synthase/folylpolyglutamate synthase